ncbi:MAG: hypothetical protein ACYDC6_10345 [Acidobacteriaceae bacterium]
MPNMLLPPEERNLTPDQVVAVDKRRFRGLQLQVMGGILGVLATLLTVWAGQDFTYGPGWIHPMGYYMIITGTLSLACIVTGSAMRRGTPEFD